MKHIKKLFTSLFTFITTVSEVLTEANRLQAEYKGKQYRM